MSSNAAGAELANAIRNFETVIDTVSGVRVIETSAGDGVTSFLCREHDSSQWMKVMAYFILEAPEEWQLFVARRFMRVIKAGVPQVAHAWFISMRGDDMVGLLEQAGGLLTKADAHRRGVRVSAGTGAVDFAIKSPPQAPRQAPPQRGPRVPQRGRKYGDDELPEIVPPGPKVLRTVDEAGFRKEYRPTGFDHRPPVPGANRE